MLLDHNIQHHVLLLFCYQLHITARTLHRQMIIIRLKYEVGPYQPIICQLGSNRNTFYSANYNFQISAMCNVEVS